jgi:flagellar motor switch protein FliM
MTLDGLSELREGQIIRLNADTKSLVAVECEGERIFWCRLAQSKGHFALVVDSPVDRQKEFATDLLVGAPTR